MTDASKRRPGRPSNSDAQRTGNFSVRMPIELRTRLEEAAAAAGRSLNADIVWRLEKSFDTKLTYQLLDQRFEDLEGVVDELGRLEDHLAFLRYNLERLRATEGDAADTSTLARQVLQAAEQMRMTSRQGKRIQDEIEALTTDLADRARRIPELPSE